jgi:hypothetical protein
MKISFDDVGGEVIYRVSDFDLKYEEVLKGCYYQPDGTGYVKRFPNSCKYLANMKNRYSVKAKEMFDQLGRFAEVPWQDALKDFCKITNGSQLKWWLTGSCATRLRGIDIEPHDLDVMIDSRDVSRVIELLKDCLIEPIVDTDGWVTKDFGVAFLHARIDIASDPSASLDQPDPADCGPYAKDHLEKVFWEGFEIMVPPLELQLNVNRRRGRMDRVTKIAAHMGIQ